MKTGLFALALVSLSSSAFAQQELASNPAGPCFLTLQGGSGSTFYKVCISPSGNLTRLESPAGREHLDVGHAAEGWAVCTGAFDVGYVQDFDAGREDEGWQSTFSQPNGPNTLPLMITTRFYDYFTVTQHISRNTAEAEITIKMVVKNIQLTTLPNVTVLRYIDVDADGDWQDDLYTVTADSASIIDGDAPGHGVTLAAKTRSIPHTADVDGLVIWGAQEPCSTPGTTGYGGHVSTAPDDYAAGVGYNVGPLKPGRSVTVSFLYRVF